MAKRYQVIIKEIETGIEYTDNTWQKIFSDEIWENMPDSEKDKHDGRPYAYVEHKAVKDVTTEVFDQTVDELDIAGVVAVVNGLAKQP
jgi:hypothetical protein